MKTFFSCGLLFLTLTVLSGCSEPPEPPEVQQAISLEQDLWRTGANVYAPQAYKEYKAALLAGRDRLAFEQSRLSWLRDQEGLVAQFRALLEQGTQVRRQLQQNRSDLGRDIIAKSFRVTERLLALRDLGAAIKDKRLNAGNLSRVEVLLAEAKGLADNDLPLQALQRLDQADDLLDKTTARVRPLLTQFIDRTKIAHWKALVDAAVGESRQRGGFAIVINKLRRQLFLYRSGELLATYPVGLGFNPIGDKLYAGDRATPEGRYRVVGKLPNSKYYRALLLDYPNDEDRKRFADAKRRKQIPAGANIGGQIEIHGGGKHAATLGCIGLDDEEILDLYTRVNIGTPVVIVAAMNTDNLVRIALERL